MLTWAVDGGCSSEEERALGFLDHRQNRLAPLCVGGGCHFAQRKWTPWMVAFLINGRITFYNDSYDPGV